jgi:hypothetical protein|tara:strand:- start:253 stop:450 length:198 start_codon:yes stop_codon:yes gene_type:complete
MFKRKTNISEFERDKPLLTYKLIQGAIYKYERLRDDRQADTGLFEVYAKVVEDLKLIQKSFVAGE